MDKDMIDEGYGESWGLATSPTLAEERFDDFSNTFSKEKDTLSFELTKVCASPGCDTCHGNTKLETHLSRAKIDYEMIENYSELSDTCQIFSIGRKHSFSRLGISHRLFEEFYQVYGVFLSVWDYVLTFGFKSKGSELGQAACKFRQNQPIFLPDNLLGSFECAYSFSYTKLNGRRSLQNEDPDYDPWSVRPVTIYQQYNSTYNRFTFLLVSPSDEVRRDLEQEVLRLSKRNEQLNVFGLHHVILSSLHQNWGAYLRDLGSLLKLQSDNVMLRQVRTDRDSISQFSDLPVTFLDRQRLQLIEDKILDLLVIFESILDTLSRLKTQCRKHCRQDTCVDCKCTTIFEDYEDLERDVQLNQKNSQTMYKRAQGVTQLLTNLLDFENAQTAHSNESSLNRLVAEAKDENAKMMVLAERSTRDAAAVRILTVITLIYLPVTVVASFFSSQLIHVSELGAVSVVKGAWWFAAVSVPLTATTFLVWKFWLAHSLKSREKKMRAAVSAEKPDIERESLRGITRTSTMASRFLFALRNKEKRGTFESGNAA